MIEKYDQEIRKRNDEAEKKMYVVDRLNRKFERLTADKNVDENHGPLGTDLGGHYGNGEAGIALGEEDQVGEGNTKSIGS